MTQFLDADGWKREHLRWSFLISSSFFFVTAFEVLFLILIKGWRGKWDSNRSEHEVLFRGLEEEGVTDKNKPDSRSLVKSSSLCSLSTPTMTPLSHTPHCVCVAETLSACTSFPDLHCLCVPAKRSVNSSLNKNTKAHTRLLFVECVCVWM